MNKVILHGNLVRDWEIRYTATGTPLATSAIAVTEKWKGSDGTKKEKTTFINLTCFGKRAEILAKFTAKGRPILIEGKLAIDKVERDGVNRYYTKVIVESFDFVGGRRPDNGGAATLPSTPGAAVGKQPFPPPQTPSGTGDWDLPDGGADDNAVPDLPDAGDALPDLPWGEDAAF